MEGIWEYADTAERPILLISTNTRCQMMTSDLLVMTMMMTITMVYIDDDDYTDEDVNDYDDYWAHILIFIIYIFQFGLSSDFISMFAYFLKRHGNSR